jgi:hypothetical protein
MGKLTWGSRHHPHLVSDHVEGGVKSLVTSRNSALHCVRSVRERHDCVLVLPARPRRALGPSVLQRSGVDTTLGGHPPFPSDSVSRIPIQRKPVGRTPSSAMSLRSKTYTSASRTGGTGRDHRRPGSAWRTFLRAPPEPLLPRGRPRGAPKNGRTTTRTDLPCRHPPPPVTFLPAWSRERRWW